jgi:hypothetical protein
MAAATSLEADMRRLLALLMLLAAADAAALTRVLLISGLGGEAGYESTFNAQREAFAKLMQGSDTEVLELGGENARRESVQQSLENSALLSARDALIFIYLGHGSYDGREFRFNVPGPDFTARELAGWLEPVKATQLLVITSSSSGAALVPLAAPQRSLVTATRSGDQSNVTVFAGYLLQALQDSAADLNKDLQLSLQEAFDFASAAVVEHYEQRRLMATEHPTLMNPQPGFVLSSLEPQPRDAAQMALISRRNSLEAEIEALKARKGELSTERYFSRLQEYLLELALLQQQLEEGESTP